MENQSDHPTEKRKPDWHKIAKKGTLVGKFLFILFLLAIIVTGTINLINFPYSVFVVGIEISLGVISVFAFVRMSTFKPRKSYDFERLKEQKGAD